MDAPRPKQQNRGSGRGPGSQSQRKGPDGGNQHNRRETEAQAQARRAEAEARKAEAEVKLAQARAEAEARADGKRAQAKAEAETKIKETASKALFTKVQGKVSGFISEQTTLLTVDKALARAHKRVSEARREAFPNLAGQYEKVSKPYKQVTDYGQKLGGGAERLKVQVVKLVAESGMLGSKVGLIAGCIPDTIGEIPNALLIDAKSYMDATRLRVAGKVVGFFGDIINFADQRTGGHLAKHERVQNAMSFIFNRQMGQAEPTPTPQPASGGPV